MDWNYNMDEAPRDGTIILLGTGYNKAVCAGYWQDKRPQGDTWPWVVLDSDVPECVNGFLANSFTCWSRLPKFPPVEEVVDV